MRLRSTGLGKTELRCVVRKVEQKKKDSFLLHLDAVEPVRWHVRAIIEPGDLFKIFIQLLKPVNLFGVAKLFLFRRVPQPEGDW